MSRKLRVFDYVTQNALKNNNNNRAGVSYERCTGSVAEERHLWIKASKVVFRMRCSSGMGFFVIFSVGRDCMCWREKEIIEGFFRGGGNLRGPSLFSVLVGVGLAVVYG